MREPGVEVHHRVAMRHRAGALRVEVEFALSRPWTILFGPSGSGKSTILRAVAGVLRPEEAKIVRCGGGGETVLADTRREVWVRPESRAVRCAPQQAALFPHRTVRENVAYGAGTGGGGVDGLLAEFGLAGMAERYPRELSGGEAQRVNLARACAAEGSRLLLLDEPFTGLDARVRDGLVTRLRQRAESTPVLSVTHDVAEAFQLGAEVIRLEAGRVVAQGPVEEVLAEERERLLRQLGGERLPLRSTEPFLGG